MDLVAVVLRGFTGIVSVVVVHRAVGKFGHKRWFVLLQSMLEVASLCYGMVAVLIIAAAQ